MERKVIVLDYQNQRLLLDLKQNGSNSIVLVEAIRLSDGKSIKAWLMESGAIDDLEPRLFEIITNQ